MDMPDRPPLPRRRGPAAPSQDLVVPPIPAAPPETHQAALRLAADMALAGEQDRTIRGELQDAFGLTEAQARAVMRDLRTYAQRALGDEDAISVFMLRKVGALERVSQGLLEDATEEIPDEVFDAETGLPMANSVTTRMQARAARAASARAFADVTTLQTKLLGARSRYYNPRAKEDAESATLTPEQQKALDAFWKNG